MFRFFAHFATLAIAVVLFAGFAQPAEANHAWVFNGSTLHWARTASPFTLKLGDNVNAEWDMYLQAAADTWSASSVLDLAVVPGVIEEEGGVTVIPPPPPFSSSSPTCSLTLTAGKITWHTRGAQSVSITSPTGSPAVGENLPLNGSKAFKPTLGSGEHFYTLAVLGTNGKTVYCGASTVGAPLLYELGEGRVEVYNAKFGDTGWLGLAHILLNDPEHINAGKAEINDSYFNGDIPNTEHINTPAWRAQVMCHEVGHTLGLMHQDEDFNTNLGSCMDYSNVANEHPNAHDFEVLETSYGHLDAINTAAALLRGGSKGDAILHEDFSKRASWGREVRRTKDGHESIFERDLGGGKKVITSVIWAEPLLNAVKQEVKPPVRPVLKKTGRTPSGTVRTLNR